MATATTKRQKTREVKSAPPKNVTKGLIENVLADFVATGIFVFVSSTFGKAAIGLEKFGLPSVPASLAVLVVALVLLDTFNNSVLGEGTLNNPVNSLGFAAAGKGTFAAHLLRIVRPLGLEHWSKCMFHCSGWSLLH